MQSKITHSLIGGGLALFVYPGVLLAGIMSLAAESTGPTSMGSMLAGAIFNCFIIGTLIYPLVYIPFAIAAVRLRNQDVERAYRMSQIPLEFLLVLGALLFVLMLLGWLSGSE
jgi:hypothetical protein